MKNIIDKYLVNESYVTSTQKTTLNTLYMLMDKVTELSTWQETKKECKKAMVLLDKVKKILTNIEPIK